MTSAERSFKSTLKMLQALAEPIRLRAFQDIEQHGPTTALPLAKRLGIDLKKMSRHLQRLANAGVLEKGLGKVYKIPDRCVAPGERRVDDGAIVLRFGQE